MLLQSCEEGFLRGDWQLVHSITYEGAGGRGTTAIGVMVLKSGTVSTALMGVEGLALFEAVQEPGKEPLVTRALPPFDNPAFAAGLLADVTDILLPPAGDLLLVGRLEGGETICRYGSKNGRESDVIVAADGSRSLEVYRDGRRIRAIDYGPWSVVEGMNFAQDIQLTAWGVRGYSLNMTLISAEKIE